MVTAASATALPSSATPISSHSQASQSFRSSGPSSVEHHYHTIDGDDFETPDSDYENPTDDWRKALAKEDLDRLGKKESQRQDVINGKSIHGQSSFGIGDCHEPFLALTVVPVAFCIFQSFLTRNEVMSRIWGFWTSSSTGLSWLKLRARLDNTRNLSRAYSLISLMSWLGTLNAIRRWRTRSRGWDTLWATLVTS